MYTWFQNLNDSGRHLFHFRGSVGRDHRKNWFKYEVSTGPAFKLEFQHGECDDADASSMLVVGLFFFTLYFTFHLPKSWYFKKKCIATWDNNREFYLTDGRMYGFYLYEWAFVWSFHKKPLENNSKDPWWMSQYIHIDDLLLGRRETLEDDVISIEDVHFKIGEKQFKMDNLQWKRRRSFRRYIPYALYHRKWEAVEMKIEKPPMRAGKGENSYDCGDDGSFGLYTTWKGSKPTWQNRDVCAKEAVEYYVKNVMRDVSKYGSGGGERGVSRADVFSYIGPIRSESNDCAAQEVKA